jgi:hypothetical protein
MLDEGRYEGSRRREMSSWSGVRLLFCFVALLCDFALVELVVDDARYDE